MVNSRWSSVTFLIALCLSSTLILPISSKRSLFQGPLLEEKKHSAVSPLPLLEKGVGHFSEWSASTKRRFLADARAGNAGQWTIVLGNEGGDLDSLASAFALAYHLSHINSSTRAVGLLQTPEDALDLRPENKLALERINMSPGHADLLTIDELPVSPSQLSTVVKGIILVDHPVPIARWENATIVSIFDHHADQGFAPGCEPRIFTPAASCSSLIGRQLLNEIEDIDRDEYHLPHELLELLLSAIAIDSNGLRSVITTPTDEFASSRLFQRSAWANQKFHSKMEEIANDLKSAKRALDHLSIRDLLRRDWKSGLVQSQPSKPDVHLGFASVPYSLSSRIKRTPGQTVEDWFAIERNWTSEIRADVTIALTSYKTRRRSQSPSYDELFWDGSDDDDDDDDDDDECEHESIQTPANPEICDDAESEGPKGPSRSLPNFGTINLAPMTQNEFYDDDDEGPDISSTLQATGQSAFKKRKKVKEREIILVVRSDHRISESEADSLFATLYAAIESDPILDVQPWDKHRELGKRQMVWKHHVAAGGRKLIRPIVEYAVSQWA